MLQTSRNSNLLGAFVVAVYDQMINRIEADVDVGGQSAAALVVIGFNLGRSVDFLSGALQLSHSGCVRLVDKLVRSGHVERREGQDRREVALHLTESGQRRAKVILRSRHEYLDGLMQTLSGKDQKQFTAHLETLLQGMTTCDEHAEAICRFCDETACPQGRCPVTLAVVR